MHTTRMLWAAVCNVNCRAASKGSKYNKVHISGLCLPFRESKLFGRHLQGIPTRELLQGSSTTDSNSNSLNPVLAPPQDKAIWKPTSVVIVAVLGGVALVLIAYWYRRGVSNRLPTRLRNLFNIERLNEVRDSFTFYLGTMQRVLCCRLPNALQDVFSRIASRVASATLH